MSFFKSKVHSRPDDERIKGIPTGIDYNIKVKGRNEVDYKERYKSIQDFDTEIKTVINEGKKLSAEKIDYMKFHNEAGKLINKLTKCIQDNEKKYGKTPTKEQEVELEIYKAQREAVLVQYLNGTAKYLNNGGKLSDDMKANANELAKQRTENIGNILNKMEKLTGSDHQAKKLVSSTSNKWEARKESIEKATNPPEIEGLKVNGWAKPYNGR